MSTTLSHLLVLCVIHTVVIPCLYDRTAVRGGAETGLLSLFDSEFPWGEPL